MPLKLSANVAEATRLTRAGLISEALTVLQGRPRTDVKASTPGDPASATPVDSTASKSQPSKPRFAVGSKLRGFLGDRNRDVASAKTGTPAQPGATVPDAGARFDEHCFKNEAGTRKYKLFVPAGAGRKPLPLVVMLHGCTQSPDDFATGTRMNTLAQEFGFLVAYPSQPASANAARCWNWFNASDQKRGQGEPHIIAGLTRDIIAKFRADESRVYVAGLSAGGAAAAILGAAYPDLYAAIGVHSGLACGAARDMSSAFTAMRQGASPAAKSAQSPLPTIVFHGDRDTTVNPVNGDHVITQSKATGKFKTSTVRGKSADGVAYTRTCHADEASHITLEQWTIHGADHAWSGGSTHGSFTHPQGPDASREMIRFFLSNRLKAQGAKPLGRSYEQGHVA